MRLIILLLFLLWIPLVSADPCIQPTPGMTIERSAVFCPGTYYLDTEITVVGNGIEIECDQTTLRGDGLAMRLVGSDLLVKACHFSQFETALLAKDATGTLWGNHFEGVGIGIDRSSDALELRGNTFYDVLEQQRNTDESHYLAITAFAVKSAKESQYVASYLVFAIAFFALVFFGGRMVEELRR